MGWEWPRLFWWAPRALFGLVPGQVLDRDPVTGLQLTAGSRRMGPGGPTMDIDTGMPGDAGRLAYDMGTGVLVRYQVQTQSTGATIDLSLQSMP